MLKRRTTCGRASALPRRDCSGADYMLRVELRVVLRVMLRVPVTEWC